MLTRKKFIQKYKSDCNYYFDGYYRNNIDDFLNKIYDDFEQKIKAKDKEIERLNCRAYHAEGYISDLHNHPKDKKFYDAKARSIVAMLFWEWKKSQRWGSKNHFAVKGNEDAFKK